MFLRLIHRLVAPAVSSLAILVAAGPVLAQDFEGARLSEHIRILADDSFEGRLPGTIGEEKTLAYLQAQYETMGLEPGGENGTWLQAVDLLRMTPSRPATASWTGPDGLVQAIETGLSLRAGALERGVTTADVKLNDLPVVFAGYGIVAPERAWDDYGQADLTGKVVIILAGQPESFGEYPNFYGSGAHKTSEALKRGALGVLTLTENPNARGMRGNVRPRTTIVGAPEARFTGVMSSQIAEAMASSTGVQMSQVLAGARAGGTFKAIDTGIKISVDIAETGQTTRSYNLLAKITGTQRPDEYIVYSAHWDHIGKTTSPNAAGDTIYNGAWDNASGTSGVLEMAKAFSEDSRPARTVVFLHVTAEEQGLLGSKWYANNPVYPLATTAANINIDMLPLTPATRSVAIFGPGKSTLEDDLARLAASQGRDGGVVGDGEPEQGFYYRSDHFSFAAGGVPALMPWTGVDFVDGGEAVGRPFYQAQMAAHYHNLEDEWRADYDFSAAIQNLDLLYRLGRELADGTAWPQWKPTAEFGRIRAETEAARQ
jgi:Zn-dependent M28 family amino/carboxypeptidase